MQSSVLRALVGAPVAASVTFMLFTLMRGLIWSDEVIIEERRAPPNLEITREDRQSDLVTRDSRPEKPDEVKAPPPPPRIEAPKSERPAEGLASVLGRLPEIQPEDVGTEDISFVVSDRDAQPLVRVEPMFPQRAAERGLAGNCLMTFNVNIDGTVDRTSIQSECSSAIFANASQRAVERWKFQPKMQKGEAVMMYGVQTDLQFEPEIRG